MDNLLVHMTLAGGSDAFGSGKKDLRDEPRSGEPNTAMNENAIEVGEARHSR